MKKADPQSRTRCLEGGSLDAKDPRDSNPMISRLFTCQNVTMAQFAARLQRLAAGYIFSPVLDSTGLEGSYDFSLNFSPAGILQMRMRNNPAPTAAGSANTPVAQDPSGGISPSMRLKSSLG
jgi:uncharacterized protein (TIGR03435 family)